MIFSTAELAAHAGSAEIERVVELGREAEHAVLNLPEGPCIDHPGAGRVA